MGPPILSRQAVRSRQTYPAMVPISRRGGRIPCRSRLPPLLRGAGDPFSVDIQYEGAVGGQSSKSPCTVPTRASKIPWWNTWLMASISVERRSVVEMLGGTNGIPLSNLALSPFDVYYQRWSWLRLARLG